ncbi:LamG domain-containing protein [Verrucomicrobiota bacterium]
MRAKIILITIFLIFLAPFIYAAPDFEITDFDTDAAKDGTATLNDEYYGRPAGQLELSVPITDKDDNLVGYWRFEDNPNDETTNNYDGIEEVSPSYGTGRFPTNAVQVSRVTHDRIRWDQAEIKDVFGDDFSIVFWVKPTQAAVVPYQRWIICKAYTNHSSPYYQVDIWQEDSPSNAIVSRLVKSTGGTYLGGTSSTIMDMNTWYFVAVTVDLTPGSEALNLYVDDDSAVTDNTPDGTYTNWDSDLAVGKNVNLTATIMYDFNGLVDEMKLYDRVLSPAEVSVLYNSGNLYRTNGNWTSAVQTMPAGEIMEQTTIYHSGLNSSNYIDKVEWLVGGTTNAIYDPVPGITNGLTTTITPGMITSGSFAAVNDDFQIKLFLVGDGSSTPSVTKIEGDTEPARGTVFRFH